MENFDQILHYLPNTKVIGTDILETGLIIFLRYLQFSLYWSDFRIIIRRTKNNDCNVQDAEDRFTELKTFKRSRKSQANMLLVKLKMKLYNKKKVLLKII
jgi:hypothetical protein